MKRVNSLWVRFVLMGLLFSTPVYAQSWSQTTAPTNRWRAVTCSADGRIIGAAGDLGLYTSTNFGGTWVSNQLPVGGTWVAMASSADGTLLAAALQNVAVFVSTNAGASWQSNAINTASYGCLGCSADGSVLALITSPYPTNAVYFSTNSGATWFPTSCPVTGLGALALSADGRRVIAANNNQFVVSTNFGRNWAMQGALPAGSSPVRTMAGSDDCTRLILANYVNLYTSANAGTTWSTNGISIRPQWLGVASSVDGARLAAVNYFGQIYSSTNSGLRWISNSVPTVPWMSVASSADGHRLVAVPLGGGIWSSYSPAAPELEIAAAGINTKVSWLIPSTDLVLEQNQDLGTTNWSIVSAVPYLNTTNLHYEVFVSTGPRNAFFRLRAR